MRRVNVYDVYGRTKKGNSILDTYGAKDAKDAEYLFRKHYPGVKIEEVELIGRGIGFFGLAFRYKTYSDEELLRLGAI